MITLWYLDVTSMFLHRVSDESEHWNGNPRTWVRFPVGMHVFHISSNASGAARAGIFENFAVCMSNSASEILPSHREQHQELPAVRVPDRLHPRRRNIHWPGKELPLASPWIRRQRFPHLRENSQVANNNHMLFMVRF